MTLPSLDIIPIYPIAKINALNYRNHFILLIKKTMKFHDVAKNPKTFLAMTGYHLNEFNHLLPYFSEAMKHTHYTLEGKKRQNQSTNSLSSPLPSNQDRLYFILVYFKQYPTQEMMGISFGLSQSKANLWIHFLTPLWLFLLWSKV